MSEIIRYYAWATVNGKITELLVVRPLGSSPRGMTQTPTGVIFRSDREAAAVVGRKNGCAA